jgi:hypothetical protein
MEQPVAIRFRWTADELVQAYRFHFRHTCRPAFRFLLHFFFGVILVGGVLMILSSGPKGKAPLPVSIGFLAVGVYYFAIRPFERRWMIRREFAKRPDKDSEIEWQADVNKIQARSVLFHGEISWQAITKLVRTPTGIMLYSTETQYHWIPRHAFASDAEFERFIELAKSKVQKFYHVA